MCIERLHLIKRSINSINRRKDKPKYFTFWQIQIFHVRGPKNLLCLMHPISGVCSIRKLRFRSSTGQTMAAAITQLRFYSSAAYQRSSFLSFLWLKYRRITNRMFAASLCTRFRVCASFMGVIRCCPLRGENCRQIGKSIEQVHLNFTQIPQLN